MSTIVSLTQAVEQYIVYRRRSHSHEYCLCVKAGIMKFLRLCRAQTPEQILRVHVNQFFEQYQTNSQVTAHVRDFLRWCKERYCSTVPQLPFKIKNRPRVAGAVVNIPNLTVEGWQAAIERIVPLMALPHQRAIFLLGYLYGYSLRKIVRLTRADIPQLPGGIRRDLYAHLNVVLSTIGTRETLFGMWLGKTHYTASTAWMKWVADPELTFRNVVWAGAMARFRAGMSPQCGVDFAQKLLRALPPISADGLERMPKFWN